MRIALALLCRSAWAYTDSCGYTATYWDDAASDFTVAASEVVAYDGSGCGAGFSYFYCEEGAGASCGGGDSTDGFDCARRARPISPCPPPPARPLSPERVPSFDPSERAAADCQNNWACPCNLVHSAACCYCSCCIASAAGATVEPTGVATPAPTTATPAPTSSPSILLYKRTHATADAEADAVFLRDNFGLNITINETAVKDEGTLGRTGGDLCAKRFGHTTLPTYSIHLFESAVTPQGPVPVADWVAYWRALHHGFVRADALVGGVAEPNANYTAERADAWDAFMYNSQTFYAPDLTPFVRRLRANGVPMFPATYNASLNPSDLSPVRGKPRQPLAETERGVDARSPAPPLRRRASARAVARARARAGAHVLALGRRAEHGPPLRGRVRARAGGPRGLVRAVPGGRVRGRARGLAHARRDARPVVGVGRHDGRAARPARPAHREGERTFPLSAERSASDATCSSRRSRSRARSPSSRTSSSASRRSTAGATSTTRPTTRPTTAPAAAAGGRA